MHQELKLDQVCFCVYIVSDLFQLSQSRQQQLICTQDFYVYFILYQTRHHKHLPLYFQAHDFHYFPLFHVHCQLFQKKRFRQPELSERLFQQTYQESSPMDQKYTFPELISEFRQLNSSLSIRTTPHKSSLKTQADTSVKQQPYQRTWFQLFYLISSSLTSKVLNEFQNDMKFQKKSL